MCYKISQLCALIWFVIIIISHQEVFQGPFNLESDPSFLNFFSIFYLIIYFLFSLILLTKISINLLDFLVWAFNFLIFFLLFSTSFTFLFIFLGKYLTLLCKISDTHIFNFQRLFSYNISVSWIWILIYRSNIFFYVSGILIQSSFFLSVLFSTTCLFLFYLRSNLLFVGFGLSVLIEVPLECMVILGWPFIFKSKAWRNRLEVLCLEVVTVNLRLHYKVLTWQDIFSFFHFRDPSMFVSKDCL